MINFKNPYLQLYYCHKTALIITATFTPNSYNLQFPYRIIDLNYWCFKNTYGYFMHISKGACTSIHVVLMLRRVWQKLIKTLNLLNKTLLWKNLKNSAEKN